MRVKLKENLNFMDYLKLKNSNKKIMIKSKKTKSNSYFENM